MFIHWYTFFLFFCDMFYDGNEEEKYVLIRYLRTIVFIMYCCFYMRFINKTTLEIDRELSMLDKFALKFVNVLKKHTEYVVVSGYVAILLGRARASEDIDIIIPRIDFSAFQMLYHDLKKKNFYCLNAEKVDDVYDYLQNNVAIRFAKKKTVIPNVELKWVRYAVDQVALDDKIMVRINEDCMMISPLELQIAFKEMVLKTSKDLEDANHLREVAKDTLDMSLIKKYKEMLHGFS